jgi:hypothetical protein
MLSKSFRGFFMYPLVLIILVLAWDNFWDKSPRVHKEVRVKIYLCMCKSVLYSQVGQELLVLQTQCVCYLWFAFLFNEFQDCFYSTIFSYQYISTGFSFVLRVISFKGLLSQWAGVLMCLPSQLCQISINSDQVSGKLKHGISCISSCL